MLKMSVLAQRIFLYMFFVICKSGNHEKIALMKIKKKCRAGAKCRARWDQNHLIFFTWPYHVNYFVPLTNHYTDDITASHLAIALAYCVISSLSF